jgi:hypothetical protein
MGKIGAGEEQLMLLMQQHFAQLLHLSKLNQIIVFTL